MTMPNIYAQTSQGADPLSQLRYLRGQQIASTSAAGSSANAAYLQQLNSFNAQDSLNKYAQGAWGSISEALDKQLKSLKGSSTAAGRFDSGFFDEDTGVVANNATRQLSDAIAGQSMNALNAQQRNTAAIGAYGEREEGIGLDLATSSFEQEANDQRERDARSRKNRSAIWGGIGTALGAAAGGFLGNPVLGGQVGGAIGGAIGG